MIDMPAPDLVRGGIRKSEKIVLTERWTGAPV